jgi:galactokinase
VLSSPARLFQSPGRVNLIGEHTDYNDGFVLPAAIDLRTIIRLQLTEGPHWQASSREITPPCRIHPNEPAAPTGRWYDYIWGVALALERRGIHIPGVSLEVLESVPLGSGLSSSAALEVAAALAFLAAANSTLPPLEIAQACLEAETRFIGLECGIMDQFIALHAQAGHALLLDCRSLEHHAIPIPAGISLVIADSGVKHRLSDSTYNERSQQARAAAQALGVQSLRDATTVNERMDPLLLRRARHVLSENKRVLAFVEALRCNEPGTLGELMAASHQSLRNDYEVSCAELDLLVDLAQHLPGHIGARMTGGGFGGSTIHLVSTEHAGVFQHLLAQRYHAATGINPTLYLSAAAGAAGPFHS